MSGDSSNAELAVNVALAIEGAPRCPRFEVRWGSLDGCDGLEGCISCLLNAAHAALTAAGLETSAIQRGAK